jgi:1,4-dihydroxy-2-naphthoate polyprenyltransferase
MADESVTERGPTKGPGLWWRTFRPVAYPASIVPVVLGVVLAWDADMAINWWLAAVTLFGAVAAHTASNMLSDYFDFRTGLDRHGTYGGSGVLVEQLLRPRDVLWGSLIAFLLSAGAAAVLILAVGTPLLWLVIVGFAAGAGYSVPLVGHKYRAMGDLAVFTAFGIGITMGAYYVQARDFAAAPLFCAISFGLLVSGILHANNMRDMSDDEAAGLRSTAVRMGESGSRVYYLILIAGAYAMVIAGVAAAHLLPGALLVVATAPMAWHLVRDVWRSSQGWQAVVAHTVERTAKLSLLFGACLIAGLTSWKLIFP